MTDPQRLLDGAGDQIEAALLRSAKPDAPSGAATRRTFAALGLAGGAVIAAGAAAASAAPPASTAVAVAKGGSFALVKWVGVATLGGLALWGATQQMNDGQAALLRSAVAPTARMVTGAAAGALNRHDHHLSQLKLSELDLPTRGSAAAPAGAVAKKPADSGDLTEEVAALDDARRAMASDPDAALEAMKAYDAKFKNKGSMGQEAEVLRIEALMRAGDVERARALGQAFLARNPSSPLAQRVRSLLSR